MATLTIWDRIRLHMGDSVFVLQSEFFKSTVVRKDPNKSGGPWDLSYLNVVLQIEPTELQLKKK